MTSQSKTILLIESNEETTTVLSRQLTQLGYHVETTGSGREAIDLVEAKRYDLILLTISLWGMNSYQVLDRFNAMGVLRTTPVLMLMPGDDTAGMEQCLTLGAVDYISQPFFPAIVKTRVEACFSHQNLHQNEQDLARREELLKIERDVQIGRKIQLGFLPDKDHLPQVPGWELSARFYPAREVAGDFYDAFMLTQKRRVGFVIADVCDKGVGAALFMFLSRSLIRAYAQQRYTLSWMDVLSDDDTGSGKHTAARIGRQALPSIGALALKNAMNLTNQYITDNHMEMNMFVTLFFGVLDPATGTVLYVNGGHLPPLIVGPAGGIKSQLATTGPAVGIFPDVEFDIEQAQLDPGDILFCYTDGVTDARDPNRVFFGNDRLKELLQKPAASASSLLSRVETTIQAHIGSADQFDDITMLALRRAPATS